MATKPGAVVAIELGDAAADRISEWIRTLTILDAGALAGTAEHGPLGQELRGAATVAAMAEMERVLRELLVHTSTELNTAGIRLKDLQPGLRSLATHSHFLRIAESTKSEAHWERRSFVTTLDKSDDIARFPPRTSSTPQPPLDGKTIKASHFSRIWSVLGLQGDALPPRPSSAPKVITTPRGTTAPPTLGSSLNALAEIRNDVAHGNAPLGEIFHPDNEGKSAKEIIVHLENIKYLLDHLCLTFSDFLSGRRYVVLQSA